MRNAALVLGIIGGLWGMVVGFFSYGWTEIVAQSDSLADAFGTPADPALIRWVSFLAPLAAIAGAAMARSVNVTGGILLLAAAGGMFHAFGFGVFTMFPIAFCGLGGVLALLARQPDAH